MDKYYFPVEPEIKNYTNDNSILKKTTAVLSYFFPFGIGIWLGAYNRSWYIESGISNPLRLTVMAATLFCIIGCAGIMLRLLMWGSEITYDMYKKIYIGEPLELGMVALAVIVVLFAVLGFITGIYFIYVTYIC